MSLGCPGTYNSRWSGGFRHVVALLYVWRMVGSCSFDPNCSEIMERCLYLPVRNCAMILAARGTSDAVQYNNVKSTGIVLPSPVSISIPQHHKKGTGAVISSILSQQKKSLQPQTEVYQGKLVVRFLSEHSDCIKRQSK